MSAPKSVIKINKNGVQYTSSVDKVNYYIFELTRAALRDVGRFVRRKFREEYYRIFKKRTGAGPKAISFKVLSSKNTVYPRIEIGIKHSSAGKPVEGFYTFFHEVGTSHEKKYGLLEKVTKGNIAEIVKIESQYLSGLESEAAALSMIAGLELEEDDDSE